MKAKREYNEWTGKAVEKRLLEAAETLALCPRAMGPRAFGNTMPHPLRRQAEVYASKKSHVRCRPSAANIGRMEECWTWVNALDDVCERRLLYLWARARTGLGRPLLAIAMKEGISTRTLRRKVTSICNRIATRLNERQTVSSTPEPVPTLSAGTARQPANVRPKTGTHWRSSGARPSIDLSQPKTRTIVRS